MVKIDGTVMTDAEYWAEFRALKKARISARRQPMDSAAAPKPTIDLPAAYARFDELVRLAVNERCPGLKVVTDLAQLNGHPIVFADLVFPQGVTLHYAIKVEHMLNRLQTECELSEFVRQLEKKIFEVGRRVCGGER